MDNNNTLSPDNLIDQVWREVYPDKNGVITINYSLREEKNRELRRLWKEL